MKSNSQKGNKYSRQVSHSVSVITELLYRDTECHDVVVPRGTKQNEETTVCSNVKRIKQ